MKASVSLSLLPKSNIFQEKAETCNKQSFKSLPHQMHCQAALLWLQIKQDKKDARDCNGCTAQQTEKRKTCILNIPPKAHLCEVAFE